MARGTCTQWESLPACEIIISILSEKETDETAVRRLSAMPDVVLEGAGKGDGWTLYDGLAVVAIAFVEFGLARVTVLSYGWQILENKCYRAQTLAVMKTCLRRLYCPDPARW